MLDMVKKEDGKPRAAVLNDGFWELTRKIEAQQVIFQELCALLDINEDERDEVQIQVVSHRLDMANSAVVESRVSSMEEVIIKAFFMIRESLVDDCGREEFSRQTSGDFCMSILPPGFKSDAKAHWVDTRDLLGCIEKYQAQRAEFDRLVALDPANEDLWYEITYAPHAKALRAWKRPAENAKEAFAALKVAADATRYDEEDFMIEPGYDAELSAAMTAAAMAWLEKQA